MSKIRTMGWILKDTRPERAQSVGNMTVIPLVSAMVDNEIASPDVLELETQNYGTVVAYNPGDGNQTGTAISPLGNLIMTSKRAQNHAVPNMRLVKKEKKVVMKNAACVQQSQGGLIPRDRHKLMLLPVALREEALSTRKQRAYDKLWEPIKAFNRSMGLKSRGHLEDFMDRFAREMEEFVAQFERVPRQVGAIILIGGEVIGVERFPNYRFFEAMFKPLIRECYGSMSIQAARRAGVMAPKNRVPLDGRGVKDLAGIKAALKKAETRVRETTRTLISGFIQTPFTVKPEERSFTLKIETLSNPEFIGQMVRKGDVPIMFSLVKTRNWLLGTSCSPNAGTGEFRDGWNA